MVLNAFAFEWIKILGQYEKKVEEIPMGSLWRDIKVHGYSEQRG